ncbi:extracellular solute-binding protein [Sansalvadorimonas sp. 2012CJ34-2]|uniref:Extracellular solute-binding protein n=1 Tax=Parendozoicomonas callyspongiae TaxID=2942213 RepID=A0ABT0PEP3_9GAMM|nr:extracellular solute-binding protein [Sansalvadorimonas sp. 2012CJ34-2]MCL6269835.1 extracellular solute-binding protein [Sansalvadorimonas sp. 2012CJ34-2]
MTTPRALTLLAFYLVVFLVLAKSGYSRAEESGIIFSHAISLHGKPALPPDYKHFKHVKPDAPKGGTIRIAAMGTFDTFNVYGSQGKAAYGLYLTNSSLLTRNWDEPLTKYGVMVEKIEQPADNSWVAFHINPKAVFSDGKPVTAKDIVFSFNILQSEGSLFWQQFYQDVEAVKATSEHRVLFTFKHNRNRELPLLIGQLPVLPEHWWKDRGFNADLLEPPVVSGAYKIKRFAAGRFIEYERIKNYWAENHPANVGRNNFDIVRYDYYRDSNVILEALNSGQLDWHIEGYPRYWLEGYSKSALKTGKLIKGTWKNHNPQTSSLVLNSRRAPFNDIRVREAVAVLLDVDWVVANLLSNMMVRAKSFFDGSELAATGLPEGKELELLSKWKGDLPQRIFTDIWPPAGSMARREKLKYAISLFKEAGFQLEQGVMKTPSGKPFSFEILLGDPSNERLLQTQVRRFAEAGITMTIKTAESARYLKSIRALDFDAILHSFRHTPSPGIEQRSFWSSANLNEEGTLNLAGVNIPAIDEITEAIPASKSWAELVTKIKAMDRILLWHFQAIPMIYNPSWQIAYSNRVSPPDNLPRYSVERTTWFATEPTKLDDSVKQ